MDIRAIDPTVRSFSVVVVKSGSIHSTNVLSTTCKEEVTQYHLACDWRSTIAHHLMYQTNELACHGCVVDTTRVHSYSENLLTIMCDKVPP